MYVFRFLLNTLIDIAIYCDLYCFLIVCLLCAVEEVVPRLPPPLSLSS